MIKLVRFFGLILRQEDTIGENIYLSDHKGVKSKYIMRSPCLHDSGQLGNLNREFGYHTLIHIPLNCDVQSFENSLFFLISLATLKNRV